MLAAYLKLKWIPIEFLKFSMVGLFNTAITLFIIYSLKWYLYWSDVSANLVGYLVGISFGFFLNGRWTFGKLALNSKHLWGYLLATLFAYSINLCAVLISIKIIGIDGDFAHLVGMPVFTTTSFLLNKKFVFSDVPCILVRKLLGIPVSR